jgi:hypothetical protein
MSSRKKKIGRKKPQDQFGHEKQKIPKSRRRRRIPKRKKNSRVKEEEESLHLQHLSAKNRSCQGKRHCEKRTRLPRVFG